GVAGQRDPARPPGAPDRSHAALSRDRQRAPHRVLEDVGRRPGATVHRGQSRSAPHAARLRGGARGRRRVPGQDLLDDVEYTWHRGWNYVRFDPDIRQGHILWLPTFPT